MLLRNGIAVVGFTASTVGANTFGGLPVAPLTDLHRWRYDRLLVASQHFYAVRTRLRALDPTGRPMLPLADVGDGDHRRGLVIVVERAAHGSGRSSPGVAPGRPLLDERDHAHHLADPLVEGDRRVIAERVDLGVRDLVVALVEILADVGLVQVERLQRRIARATSIFV